MKKGSWIGIGVAIGAVLMATTGEAFWIAIGVAIGAAMESANKSKKGDGEMVKSRMCNAGDSEPLQYSLIMSQLNL